MFGFNSVCFHLPLLHLGTQERHIFPFFSFKVRVSSCLLLIFSYIYYFVTLIISDLLEGSKNVDRYKFVYNAKMLYVKIVQ